MGEDGLLFAQVRSSLVITLICSSDSPSLRALPLDHLSDVFYLLFCDGGLRGNPGPGGAGSVIVQLHIQKHAACVRWLSSMACDSANTTNNVTAYWGLVHGLRQAKASVYLPLHVVEDSAIVLSQPERTTLHSSHTWRCYFEKQEYLLMISVSPAGDITISRLANIAMDTDPQFKSTLPPRQILMRRLRHSSTMMSTTGWRHLMSNITNLMTKIQDMLSNRRFE